MKKILYTVLIYLFFLNNFLISEENNIKMRDLCNKYPYACSSGITSQNNMSGGRVVPDKERPQKTESEQKYEDRKIIRKKN